MFVVDVDLLSVTSLGGNVLWRKLHRILSQRFATEGLLRGMFTFGLIGKSGERAGGRNGGRALGKVLHKILC